TVPPLRLRELPWDEPAVLLIEPRRVVLVPALTAESQGEEHCLPFPAGRELLGVHRHEALARVLGCGVDSVALADELVQPEGEQRPACRRVSRLAAGEQNRLQGPLAKRAVEPRELRERLGGAAFAAQTPRRGTY